jgi:hypothetical protein
MPDLTFRRGAPAPVKQVCMYCGRPATHARERRVRNPRLDPPPGGADHGASGVPTGDDPVSGCIALVLLPFVLVGLGRQLRDSWRHRVARWRAPPLDPPDTVVTVTTCDRHRHYGRRFVWGATLGLIVIAAGWAAMTLLDRDRLGAPLWLAGGTVVATVAFPVVFLYLWATDGPVRISRVARDTVTLSDVRGAYFDARD